MDVKEVEVKVEGVEEGLAVAEALLFGRPVVALVDVVSAVLSAAALELEAL